MTHKLDAKEINSLEIDGVGEVKTGMILEHPMFGIGEVEAIFEFAKSGENSIRLKFEKYGSKALSPEYAKLSLPNKKEGKPSFWGNLFKRGK